MRIHTQSLDKDISEILSSAHSEGTLAGKNKEICLFRNADTHRGHHLISVGLGDIKKANLETVRQSTAAALNCIKTNQFKNICIDIDSACRIVGKLDEVAYAITEGLILSHYSFDTYKNTSSKKKEKEDEIDVTLTNKTGTAKKAIENAQIICGAVNFARTLGDTPGNLMTPEILAKTTQSKAKGSSLKVTAWDKARIKKERMGGLYGVSLGSAVEPRFILMEYKGATPSKKPILFCWQRVNL